MSGQPLKTRNAFIPPPIDGLNLIAPPNQLQDTEARVLDNYLVYDWGIRKRGVLTSNSTFSGDGETVYAMKRFFDPANFGDETVLIATGTKFYTLTTAGGTPSLVGSAAAGSINRSTMAEVSSALFNKCIFVFGYTGGAHINKFTLDSHAITADPFTFSSTTVQVSQGEGYKHRLYMVAWPSNIGGQQFGYGGVDAVSGDATIYDLSQVFTDSGILLFVTPWTYNQGLGNDELFVACSASGEVLIYSGDNPEASNWVLVGRVRIPQPLGSSAYYRLGSDLLIGTERGLISLSQVFKGNTSDAGYYTASRKLGGTVLGLNGIVQDLNAPFLYAAVSGLTNYPDGTYSAAEKSYYILNFERGAWSRMPLPFTLDAGIACYAFGTMLFSDADWTNSFDTASTLYHIANTGVDTDATYKWSTKFFDFGTNLQKKANGIRLLGRATSLGGTLTDALNNSVSISTNYSDLNAGNSVGATDDAPANQETLVQEISPAGVGYSLSYIFSEAPDSSTAQTEILGFQAFLEDGGVY